MKRYGIFLICFLFSAFTGRLFSQQTGYALCTNLLNSIQTGDFRIETEPLAYSEEGGYPFNIQLSFPQKLGYIPGLVPVEQDEADLYLLIPAEDAAKHVQLISDFISALAETKRDYRLKVVFSYGDYPLVGSDSELNGAQVFLSGIVGGKGISVICLRFSEGENTVFAGGGKYAAPKYLVSLAAAAFQEAAMPYTLSGGMLLPLHRFGILESGGLAERFLKNGFPALTVNLQTAYKNPGEYQKTLAFLERLADAYDTDKAAEKDLHFTAIKIAGRTHFISGAATVYAFMLVAFIALFFLCEFSFLNAERAKNILRGVKKIWYLIPLTLLVSALSLMLGGKLADFFYAVLRISKFERVALKIIAGFSIISVLFALSARLHGAFDSKSYAYLLTIAAAGNLFAFSMLEIALFYLFAAEFVIVYASRAVKRTLWLCAAALILALPFIPYAVSALKYLSENAVASLAGPSIAPNLLLAAVFLPFAFIWLRIFMRLNKKWKKLALSGKKTRRRNLIAFAAAGALLVIALTGIKSLFIERFRLPDAHAHILIAPGLDERLRVSYRDGDYFGETARTISVSLTASPETCSVVLEGRGKNSVLYSEYPYLSEKKAFRDSFLIPASPPKRMTFRYIADSSAACTLRVRALFPDASRLSNRKKRYLSYSKSIVIPAAQKDEGK